MPALTSITAVRPTANTKILLLAYGATIAAGQSLYVDSSELCQLADCDLSAAAATVKGIAVTPGVNGGYGYVAVEGSIILVGTTMTVGQVYCLGDTAGAIVPESDLATGDRVSILGTASTSTQLDLSIKNTGIVHA